MQTGNGFLTLLQTIDIQLFMLIGMMIYSGSTGSIGAHHGYDAPKWYNHPVRAVIQLVV
jgi:hypothetical protein